MKWVAQVIPTPRLHGECRSQKVLEGGAGGPGRSVGLAEPAAQPQRAHCPATVVRNASDDIRIPGAEESGGLAGEGELRRCAELPPGAAAYAERGDARLLLDEPADDSGADGNAGTHRFDQRTTRTRGESIRARAKTDRPADRDARAATLCERGPKIAATLAGPDPALEQRQGRVRGEIEGRRQTLRGWRDRERAETRSAGVSYHAGPSPDGRPTLCRESKRRRGEQRQKRNRSRAHGTGKIQRPPFWLLRAVADCSNAPVHLDRHDQADAREKPAWLGSRAWPASPVLRRDAASRASPGSPAVPGLPAGYRDQPPHHARASRGGQSPRPLWPWRHPTGARSGLPL